MGNSSGNLDAWAAAFEAHPAAQGGFIWDWVDQGLAAVGPRGERFFKFGGDSGETIHDAQFCVNGLLFPDRTPHPAMYEVRLVRVRVRANPNPNPNPNPDPGRSARRTIGSGAAQLSE